MPTANNATDLTTTFFGLAISPVFCYYTAINIELTASSYLIIETF